MKKVFIIIALIIIALLIIKVGFFSNRCLRYFYPEKIWHHRTNSLDALQKAQPFQGLEIDIVYIDSLHILDVHHPPSPPSGLTLSQLLASDQKNDSHHYWLDLKNLTQGNVSNIIQLLDSMSNQISIASHQFIIESPNPQYLKTFQLHDYLTAYYLPNNLYTLEQAARDSLLQTIEVTIDAYSTDYISFDYLNYEIIQARFPNEKKNSWAHNFNCSYINILLRRLLLIEALNDHTIKYMLL
ncbi:MAG: hypothetical protein OCC49_12395 [Fibrobacterales bacterium]